MQSSAVKIDPTARTARTQAIIDHLVARLRTAEVKTHPFQNFFLTNAFPADVYASIRKSMPSRDCYRPLNLKQWKNAEGLSTRDRLGLSEGDISRIEPAHQALWTDVTRALEAPELLSAVMVAMKDDVALRLGCKPEDVAKYEATPDVILVRDFAEYKLKPHPDGQPRVVTMMFYLAEDGDPTDLGTSLYRERPLFERLIKGRFEEVDRFPFLPNSVGTFAVNQTPERTSWHGKELIVGKSIIRDSIILSILSQRRDRVGPKHAY
jgi:hypothetical protein